MKHDEIRGMSDADLRARVTALEEERFRLRFRGATETLEDPLRLRSVRRDVARVLTVLRERELDAAKGGASKGARKGASKGARKGARKGATKGAAKPATKGATKGAAKAATKGAAKKTATAASGTRGGRKTAAKTAR